MTVEYKTVRRFPAYRVGTDGSVWTRWTRGTKKEAVLGNRWRKMKPRVRDGGHLYVGLVGPNGEEVRRWVHELVLTLFVGPRPKGKVARHYPDRDPSNNRKENLSWASQKTNQLDRREHGTDPRGTRNGMAVLTDEIASAILRDYEKRTCSKKGFCKDQAAMHGVSPSTIYQLVVKRSTWTHLTV